MELLHSEVVSYVLQNLVVEKIPDLNSAAEENNLLKGDMADDVSHSLIKHWDVLSLADGHFGEKDVHIIIWYTSMFKGVVSKA